MRISKRVKNLVKQGKTLYLVWVYYPYCGHNVEDTSRSRCEVLEVKCMSRIHQDTNTGSYYFHGISTGEVVNPQGFEAEVGLAKYIGGVLCKRYYPQDMGLMTDEECPVYHRTFTSMRRAQRFVDQIKSGCNIK